MALSDRYPEIDTRTRFEKWLDGLSKDNRRVVDSWLADTNLSNMKLVQMIRDDDPEDGFVGYRATKDTLADYRRGLRG